jgi:alpha-glucuronidase
MMDVIRTRRGCNIRVWTERDLYLVGVVSRFVQNNSIPCRGEKEKREMSMRKIIFNRSKWLLLAAALLPANLMAYNGSDAFLHYSKAPPALLSQYQGVCKSIVLSSENSDTLKNAKTELDSAMPRILGGSALPVADGAGAIVLAEQGSAPVTSAGIDYSGVTNEGFIIKTVGGKTYITGKTQVGVLRGTYHFLRLMQAGKDITSLNVVENPYFAYRVLDHWYNHYSSSYEADRLYGGSRVFKMEDFGNLSGDALKRVINYCRMAAALGLNGITPDCVNTYQSGSNANYKCLEVVNLKAQKVFADIIGTYGLKYYLSVSYASPRLVTPKISSADAYKNSAAKQWWKDKVDTVRVYIKNFGGFLMKADSEGEEGPRSTYSESQSQGANPIAEALGRYGLIIVWRTFIYGTSDPDFAVNQGKEFAKPAQTWDSAVVIRMKDGTHDFQPIEPPHQLLTMSGVRKGMELQITQEYTGQGIHLDWLVPRWKKALDWDIKGAPTAWNGAPGTLAHQLLKGSGSRTGGLWGISNLSDTVNWTGHFFAQANYYGFGRLAWNPTLSSEEIAEEWIRCSVDNGYNPVVLNVMKHMLLHSWQAYMNYVIAHNASMSQIGNNNHYEVDFDGMHSISFYNDWLMNFTSNGIGVERCGQSTTGSVHNDYAHDFLTSALADSFSNPSKCPEEYMLFFHHYGWEFKMKGGMTLIQQLQFEHFNGIHEVQRFIKYWKYLTTSGLMDAGIYSHVLSKLDKQLTDATRWANTFRSQFGTKYSTQVPCHLDIITPDTAKAAETDVGAPVNLSATLKSQNGTAVTGATFNWSVVEPGATLSAATGASTVFSATAGGIYTVKVWDSRWPNQFETELIFVKSPVGTRGVGNRSEPLSLKITRTPFHVVITTPLSGKICIVGLEGRVVKSISAGKAGTLVWDTRGAARGLYLLQVQSAAQTLRSRLFIQ